jgi:glycerol-3-phosphate acyltransferase PlsY
VTAFTAPAAPLAASAGAPAAVPVVASVLAAAFLLGAVPFSYVIARLRGIDLQRIGSGNIGATNLARAAGAALGLTGLLLDAAKGAAAVALARALADGGTLVPAVAGLVAVLGHNFTPFLRFRGGKGVATGAGAFALLAPAPLLLAVAAFVAAFALSRIVALGSILAALTLPVAIHLLEGNPALTGCAAALALLVLARHRANIARMLRGTEHRFGGRRSDGAPSGTAGGPA